jgi:hypothetical protein
MSAGRTSTTAVTARSDGGDLFRALTAVQQWADLSDELGQADCGSAREVLEHRRLGMAGERSLDGVLEARDLGVQDSDLGDRSGHDGGEDLRAERGDRRWGGTKALDELGVDQHVARWLTKSRECGSFRRRLGELGKGSRA